MDRTVDKIRLLISKKQEILYEQLNFGACEASVEKFKSLINFELPNEFYKFYETFNGSTRSSAPVWGKMRLLPFSEIIETKSLLENPSKDNTLKIEQWSNRYLPFLSDKEGSFICIDRTSNDAIVEISKDFLESQTIFKSFHDWLLAFLYLLENFNRDIVIDNDYYQSFFNNIINNLKKKINEAK